MWCPNCRKEVPAGAGQCPACGGGLVKMVVAVRPPVQPAMEFLLFLSDRLPRGTKTARNASMVDALLVGAAQAVAVVPGLSRSGTTIAAGMARGFDRSFAVKFSFLLSIPAVLGANVLSIADAVRAGIDTSLLPVYLVGVVVAMVSGYAAIGLLRFIARKGRFGGFAYYCWGAGLVTLILSLIS